MIRLIVKNKLYKKNFVKSVQLLDGQSYVLLAGDRVSLVGNENIHVVRHGENLVIQTSNGEQFILENFFANITTSLGEQQLLSWNDAAGAQHNVVSFTLVNAELLDAGNDDRTTIVYLPNGDVVATPTIFPSKSVPPFIIVGLSAFALYGGSRLHDSSPPPQLNKPNTPNLRLASDTGVNASDGLTNNATINVLGLESASGTTWSYQVDGTAGSWIAGTGSSFLASSSAHTYFVRQIDAAGNISSVNASLYTLDTSPPAAPSLILASDTGVNASDGLTNNATINVLGLESAAGTSWAYQVDGTAGSWITGTGSSFLATNGAHTYFVRQIDATGNVSPVNTRLYTLDTSPPTAPSLILASDTGVNASDGLTNNATVNVLGLESTTGTTWAYQVDGTAGSWITGAGSNFLATNGAHTYFVRQSDAAGNVSPINTSTYTLVDINPPAAPSLILASDTGVNASDGLTNNATVNVLGLESAIGTTWSYQIDGTAGSWITGTSSSFLATNGAHTYFVRQSDATGNVSPVHTRLYTLDTSPPTAPSLILASDTGVNASDGLTNNATVNVLGLESTTGTTWAYQVDGTAGSWITGAGSSFLATNGAHTYFVRQSDAAGNVSPVNTSTYTLVDISPPAAPSLVLASDTGVNASDGLTNNATVNVLGLESATGTTWAYQVDGTTGSWITGTNSSFLASSGAHTYFVRQSDAAGNISPVNTHLYTLDTSPAAAPSLILASDSGGNASDGLTNNATVNVLGLESAAGTTWVYQVDGTAGSWITGTGSSFLATSGAHTYFVRQSDAAGNVSPVNTRLYTLDTTPPTAPSLILASDTGVNASDGLTNNATVNVLGLESASGTTWAYQVDGTTGSWITGTNSSFLASSGAHTYFVRQIDAAGNVSPVNTRLYTLDTSPATAPSLILASDTGVNASDGLTNNATVNVLGLESATGTTWAYQVDGTAGNWIAGTGSSFLATSGAHTYFVRQSDAAGNVSPVNTSLYTLDTTPPTAPSLILASDTGVSSSDGLTNNATVNVLGLESATGTIWAYQVDGTAGSWITGTGSSLLASSGAHTYFVRQSDAAGNVSAVNTSLYTLDTSLPAAPSLILASDTGVSASDGLTNNATVNVLGLESATGAIWAYQVDGTAGNWITGTGSSFLATSGAHTYFVRQSDVAGNNSAFNTATYTLDSSAPSGLGISDGSGNVDENSVGAVTLTANLNDIVANPSVTWSLGVGGDNALFRLTNGVLSFVSAPNYELPRGSLPSASNSNAYTVNVIAHDAAGNEARQAIVVNVTDENEAPIAPAIGAQFVSTNQGLSLNAAFTDPDTGNTDASAITGNWGVLRYTTTGLPPGINIDANTGMISGTATAFITTTVTVTATDGGGLSTTTTFVLGIINGGAVTSFTVSDAGNGNGTQLGRVGEALTFTVTMNEALTLNTTLGTPSITFTLNGHAVTANYLSGSGSAILKFTGANVPVGDGQLSVLSSISLNGATSIGLNSNEAWDTTLVGQNYTGYTVDNTPPVTPTLRLASDTGINTSDGLTNNATINVLALESASGTTWSYQVDGTAGSWIAGTSSSFLASSGAHTYFVRQSDAAGNVSAVNTSLYTLDSTPPVPLSLRLASDTGSSSSDGLTSNPTILVLGLESATGTTWSYQVDGTAGSWIAGTSSSFLASSGAHTYFVRQNDAAGNVSPLTSATYSLDNSLPNTAALALAFDNGFSTSDNITAFSTIKVTGIESATSWSYQIDSTTGSWIIGSGSSFNAIAGRHTYFVQQTNAVGNVSANSAMAIYTLDAPLATTVPLSAIASGNSGFVINGQVIGDFAGYSVAGAGDVNGDGLDDVIVGAYIANNLAGRSYVVFGRTNTASVSLNNIANGSGGFVINGRAGDWSGFSVATAGDVNGDGLTDLLVSARSAAGAGHSFLVFGKTNTSAVNLHDVNNGTGGFVINGEKSGDISGFSVSSAGDVNGDGLTDLIVGAYGSDEESGRSYVIFGKSSSSAVNLVDIKNGTGGFVIKGSMINSRSGWSVSAAGDVNGDGLADVIIGASSDFVGSNGNSFVVFGKADTSSIDLASVAMGTGGFIINWQLASDQSGFSVSAAGDVNGDGLSDLIIGAPYANNRAGKSYIVFGKSNNRAIDLNEVASGTGGFVIVGQSANDNSGWSVDAAGDINGDGLSDVLIGTNGTASKAYVVYGKTNSQLVNLNVIAAGTGGFLINGESSGDRSGSSVSAAGDVNGDGFADLIIGAYDATNAGIYSGRSYVIFGGAGRVLNGNVLIRGSGIVNGTVNDETIIGSSGDDTLSGGGGFDRFFAGAGDDIILLTASDITKLYNQPPNPNLVFSIDGGSGIDTLRLSGVTNLYLPEIPNITTGNPNIKSRLSSIEVIDLASDVAANNLQLRVNDVIYMTGMNSFNVSNGWSNVGAGTALNDLRHRLLIKGTATDTLYTSDWTLLSDSVTDSHGDSYKVYNSLSGLAQLLVSQAMRVVVQPLVRNVRLVGANNNVFTNDDIVTVTVTMDIPVVVNGAPQIELRIGNQFVFADYATISADNNTLIFTYSIQHDQFDGNGISLTANGINLNSATIKSLSDVYANLNYAPLTNAPNTLVDGLTIYLKKLAVTSLGFVINNNQSDALQSGYSVASAGDVNGDGLMDLIVGAPYSNGLTGKSYLVFGKNSYTPLNLSAVEMGSGGFIINGDQRYKYSGFELASAGDINGDGLSDLIVSARGNASNVDLTYVVFGKADTNPIQLGTLSSNAGFKIYGESVNNQTGFSVSSAGDVNGDGFVDLFIAAPGGNGQIGKSYVVFGNPNNNSDIYLLTIAAGTGGFVINGANADDQSGYSVAGLGDINGDGLADLLIGSPVANSGSGKSYVVFGKTNSSAINLSKVATGQGGFVITGEAEADKSGWSVAALGDVNGDDLNDFAISAPFSNTGIGKIYVVFGKTDSTAVNLKQVVLGQGGFVINGKDANGFSGWAVSAAGDINGDGLADLLISAPVVNAGRSYVVYGKTDTVAVDISAVSLNSGGFAISGENNGDKSGSSLANAGDINGDGLVDLLIGAPAANTFAGANYVLFNTLNHVQGSVVQQRGVVTGSLDDELILGSDTNDTLSGGGGLDRFFAGAGNDIVILTTPDIANLVTPVANGLLAVVDGGTGIDTLRLSDSANLDLTTISNLALGNTNLRSRISSIERIDLATDNAANTLTLSVRDVVDMAGMNSFNTGNGWSNVGAGTVLSAKVQKHQLVIDGTAADALRLSGWLLQAGSVSDGAQNYRVYNSLSGSAQLLVASAIQVPSTFVQTVTLQSVSNRLLVIGDVVTAEVLMSNAVNVSDTPQLALTIGNQIVNAQYASGSGTATLLFTYVIQARNLDSNGISIAANSLSLNGGRIEAVGDGQAALLIHDAGIDDSRFIVDAVNIRLSALARDGFVLNGEANMGSGYGVTTVGDINGDGFADFMISAFGAPYSRGKSYVVFGKANWSGISAVNLSAIAAGSGGFALNDEVVAGNLNRHSGSAAGDINGDGLADFIVGAPDVWGGTGKSGKSYVVFGRQNWSGVSTLNLSVIAAGSGGFALNAEVSGDENGYSVASAGDVNGDGYTDFIIGARHAYNGSIAFAGKSYVVFGRPNWSGVSTLNLSVIAAGSGGFVLGGELPSDDSGTSVASAGDINGDGLADLIVAAPKLNPGTSYVIFGRLNWSGISAVNLSTIAAGSGGFVLNGGASGGDSMISVASAGDINGDGYADVIIGGHSANNNTGTSYVVFGKANWSGISAVNLSAIAAGSGGFVLNGEGENDDSGYSVATAGDINGDGYADLIIGAQGANSNAGKSYVVFGRSSWSGVSALNLSTMAQGSSGFVVNGEALGDNSGYSVSSAGDINGDGFADLIIGAKGANSNAGKSYIIFGGARFITSTLVQGRGTVTGSDNDEVLVGSTGDDILTGGGGVVPFFGGAGNDIIVLTNSDISNLANVSVASGVRATVDGGTGIDTLRLSVGANLDLTTIANSAAGTPTIKSIIASIEGIDLATDSAANTLTLSVNDVLDMAGMNNFNTGNGWSNVSTGTALSASVQKHQLLIDGTVQDVLRLTERWILQSGQVTNSASGSVKSYKVYNSSSSAAQLLVDNNIQTQAFVQNIALVTSPNILSINNVVTATVTMDSAVNVNGTPQLGLIIGNQAVTANYASGSGSSTLIFTYTILARQFDANGVSVAANSLTLSGGTINTVANELAAVLIHDKVADNAGVLADSINIRLDALGNSGLLLNGEAANDRSGFSVATAGDINGDGFADFIIGAYDANSSAGKSYVVFGKANWSGSTAVNLNTVAAGSGGFVLIGETASDRSGYSVAVIGDINGDSYSDFMVGGYSADSGAGKSYVVFGRSNWSGVSALNLNTVAAGSGGFVVNGELAGANSGWSVATAGDINGDGYADFMIGAKGANSGAGKSYMVFGKANWSGVSALNLSTVAAGSGGFVVNGELANANSGWSVATAGDINGDGYADFMIGAKGANSNAGKSYVVFGKANWSGVSALNLGVVAQGSGGFVVNGEASNDNSGTSVATVGDINGDGYADFIIGANAANSSAGKSYVVFGKGNWSGLSALNLGTIAAGTGGFVLNGETANDNSGTSVAAIGDINADGYADFIVGARGANSNTGKTYVVFGRSNWSGISTLNLSTLEQTGSGGFVLIGNTSSNLGRSVSVAGDINGDGFADIIVGAPNAMINAMSAVGQSYIIFGGARFISARLVQGSGTVTGTVADEAVVGSSGADVLTGGGGVDRFFGGANDDTIVITSSDFNNLVSMGTGGVRATIDGGTGIDTLRLSGAVNLDLTAISNIAAGAPLISSRISSIERIDLASDSAANTLSLTEKDVLDMAGMNSFNTSNGWNNVGVGTVLTANVQKHQLVIDGMQDILRPIGSWILQNGQVTNSSSGIIKTYKVYNSSSGAAQLLVGTNVHVPILVQQISLSTSSNMLGTGRVVTATVTMDADVNVSGTPQIALTIGNQVVEANYASGSGSSTLIFTYLILSKQFDANGISIAANSLTLNGGSINSVASGRLVTLEHSAISDSLSSVVDAVTVPLDAIIAGSGGFVINGQNANTSSGYSVAGIGDVNGDGLTDLLVGAPASNGWAGVSYVVFGKTNTSQIDLGAIANGSGGFLISGEVVNDKSGWSVAAAGDINGDGLADLLLGAPAANGLAGKSYVVFGKSNGLAVNLSMVATGTGGFVINGQNSGDASGYSVSSAGDINGDGINDLIIGAAGVDNNTGASYVVFGKMDTSTINLSSIVAGSGGFVVTGSNANDYSGWNVSAAGDVNGDGLADLIIGATADSAAGAGKSYVVFGKNNTSAVRTSAIEAGQGGFVINGEQSGDHSGWNVAVAGDVNGDGLADLIISATADSAIGSGKVYVVFGKTNTAAVNLSAVVMGTGGFAVIGEIRDDRVGYGLAAAGDINGDGLADFIVGAPYTNGANGASYVIFGKTDTSAVRLNNLADSMHGFKIQETQLTGANYTGSSVASAGDVNGDGFADLIVGAPGADISAGRSYVILGSASNISFNGSLLVQGAGAIAGTTANEAIVGSNGADSLSGGGGVDRFFGGAGNDTIVITASDLANLTSNTVIYGALSTIDGGTGIDTLRLSGVANLNFGAFINTPSGNPVITSRISNIERIDLASDPNANTLKISAGQVMNLAGMNSFNTSNGWSNVGAGTALGSMVPRHQLVIDGTTADTLVINLWTVQSNMVTSSISGSVQSYRIYNSNSGSAQLLVNSNVKVAPFILDIAVKPANNNILRVAGIASVVVNLSESVTVNGSPQLTLNINKQNVEAVYAAGSGTSQLIFTYVIQQGQLDTNGISIPADSVHLNGGSITSISTNSPIYLASLAVNDNPQVTVDAYSVQLVDLRNGNGGFTINGEVNNDQSGYSVAFAGDVNGDGVMDILIGAQNAASGAGNSYVVFGKTNTSIINLSAVAAGSGGFIIRGQSVNDNSGYSIASLGDINSDGLADFIIGASNADGGKGRAYVLFGKTNTSAINLSAIAAGTGGFAIDGLLNGELTGTSVSSAGDINGDGQADFVIGAPNTNNNRGTSYVIFGTANLSSVNLSHIVATSGGFAITGEDPNNYSSYSVASAGDVNHDGYADLIIGAYGVNGGIGKSYVVFGKTNSSAINLGAIAAGTGGFMINGHSTNDYSGYSVSAAGDVNGDGYADLIIGANGRDSNRGVSYVVFGKSDTASVNLNLVTAGTGGYSIVGQSSGDQSGYSVAYAGDINGDGLSDIIIGAPAANGNVGMAYVVFGKTNTSTINLADVIYGSGGFVLNGQGLETGKIGYSVSSLGDINNDGFSDLIVGAPNASAGVSYVLLGRASNITASSLVSGSGIIAGTNADELLMGSSGNDILMGNGGIDRFIGGAGDDIIVLKQSDVINLSNASQRSLYTTVDGGSGIDSLQVANGASINLSVIAQVAAGNPLLKNRLSSIERIDLATDASTNIMSLNANDVINLAGINSFNTTNGWENSNGSILGSEVKLHQLVIDGTHADTLLISGWALQAGAVVSRISGSTQTYHVYNNGLAQLLVDVHISVVPRVQNIVLTPASNVEHINTAYGVVTATVNMTEAVNVDGVPTLDLNIGNATVKAQYAGGSGSSSLIFTHTIQIGQRDSNGISINANSLHIADGSIVSANRGYDASLDHVAVADDPNNLVDGVTVFLERISAGTGGFVITTSEAVANRNYGWNLTSVGDVNGDGIADLLMRDLTLNAYIVFGKTDNRAIDMVAVIAGTGGFKIAHNNGSLATAIGISYGVNTVAALGDINGDGFDDFATCHLEVNVSSSPIRYVIFGKKDLSSVDLGAIAAGTGGFIINGDLTVLSTIASAGDVNGDGLGDIILGNAPLTNNERVSYVIFGKTNPANVDLNAVMAGTGGFAITSPLRTDTAWSVSSAGDFNGDGLSDILIGATGSASGSSSNTSTVDGKVFVIFGRTDTAPVRISNITSGTGGFVISGPTITHTNINQSNYTGFSISAAGDVNGDGLADIIIGATGESSAGGNPALVPRQTGAGNAYVVFGTNSSSNINLDAVANGTGGFLIRGESINDHAGYNVNAAGDINGDGLADLLVGAPFADELFGLVYVVYGKTNTQIVDLSAIAAGSGGFSINGKIDGSYTGDDAAPIDINGDGFQDLLIAAPIADSERGRSYLVLGGPGRISGGGILVQGSGNVTGTLASEALVGSSGNDTLLGGGGIDRFFAGAGDDRILLSQVDINNLVNTTTQSGLLSNINGGAGIDTLQLLGNANLNLSAIRNIAVATPDITSRIASIERIDLGHDNLNNQLTLSVNDVLDMTDFNNFNTTNGWRNLGGGDGLSAVVTRHQLIVDGNVADTVRLDAGWVLQSGTVVSSVNGTLSMYQLYNHSTKLAQLLIDTNVNVIL